MTESIFTYLLNANEKYKEAKELAYCQFVTKFVYEKRIMLTTGKKINKL